MAGKLPEKEERDRESKLGQERESKDRTGTIKKISKIKERTIKKTFKKNRTKKPIKSRNRKALIDSGPSADPGRDRAGTGCSGSNQTGRRAEQ